MRGSDTKQSSMLCLISPEARVPSEHPLRAIKKLADEALKALSQVFDEMYAVTGRPDIRTTRTPASVDNVTSSASTPG